MVAGQTTEFERLSPHDVKDLQVSSVHIKENETKNVGLFSNA